MWVEVVWFYSYSKNIIVIVRILKKLCDWILEISKWNLHKILKKGGETMKKYVKPVITKETNAEIVAQVIAQNVV